MVMDLVLYISLLWDFIIPTKLTSRIQSLTYGCELTKRNNLTPKPHGQAKLLYVFLTLCNRVLKKITYCILSVEKCWYILLIAMFLKESLDSSAAVFSRLLHCSQRQNSWKKRMDWKLRVFYKFQAADHIPLWNKYFASAFIENL